MALSDATTELQTAMMFCLHPVLRPTLYLYMFWGTLLQANLSWIKLHPCRRYFTWKRNTMHEDNLFTEYRWLKLDKRDWTVWSQELNDRQPCCFAYTEFLDLLCMLVSVRIRTGRYIFIASYIFALAHTPILGGMFCSGTAYVCTGI